MKYSRIGFAVKLNHDMPLSFSLEGAKFFLAYKEQRCRVYGLVFFMYYLGSRMKIFG